MAAGHAAHHELGRRLSLGPPNVFRSVAQSATEYMPKLSGLATSCKGRIASALSVEVGDVDRVHVDDVDVAEAEQGQVLEDLAAETAAGCERASSSSSPYPAPITRILTCSRTKALTWCSVSSLDEERQAAGSAPGPSRAACSLFAREQTRTWSPGSKLGSAQALDRSSSLSRCEKSRGAALPFEAAAAAMMVGA